MATFSPWRWTPAEGHGIAGGEAPLLTFRGLVDGVVADVAVHGDHIAWTRRPGLFVQLVRETKIVSLRMVSSVTTSRDGLWWTRVRLTSMGNVIEFRVSHEVAAQVKATIEPIVVAGPGGARPAPVPELPPPGWYADPAGSYALRWWDGANWSWHLQPLGPPAACAS